MLKLELSIQEVNTIINVLSLSVDKLKITKLEEYDFFKQQVKAQTALICKLDKYIKIV